MKTADLERAVDTAGRCPSIVAGEPCGRDRTDGGRPGWDNLNRDRSRIDLKDAVGHGERHRHWAWDRCAWTRLQVDQEGEAENGDIISLDGLTRHDRDRSSGALERWNCCSGWSAGLTELRGLGCAGRGQVVDAG